MKKGRNSSKESSSHLFNRYVWLIDVIYQSGKITFEQINNKWCRSELNPSGEDIPLRTFHNHRKAIEQMFDINIECDKRNGYIYYIEYSEDMKRGGVRSWLLNTFAINNLINESHKLKYRILFEKIPSGQQFLAPILEAMRDGIWWAKVPLTTPHVSIRSTELRRFIRLITTSSYPMNSMRRSIFPPASA